MVQALVLCFAIIIYVAARTGKAERAAAGGVGGTGLNQEVSFRAVFLAVFFFCNYAVAVFLLSRLINRLLPSMQVAWHRDLITFFSAGIPPGIFFWFLFPWLSWRICDAARFFRLGRFFYWFSPGARKVDLANFAILSDAVRGIAPVPPPPERNGFREKLLKFFLLYRKPRPFVVDGWAVVALALVREVQGDHIRAERLLRSFDICPPGIGTLGNLRHYAFEELAWHAAAHGDWEAVLHRVSLGGSRRSLLLRRIAEAHLDGRANSIALWLMLVISPRRLRAFRLIRDVTRPGRLPDAPSRGAGYGGGTRDTHLRLLSRVSEGDPVEMEDVLLLAEAWDDEFARRKEDRLLRRGMELGARDVLGIAQRVEEGVLDELEELAAGADGCIPERFRAAMKDAGQTLVARLALRFRSRLHDELNRITELFQVAPEEKVPDADLLERWESWLALHESAERLQRLMGTDELAAAWYGGLRDAVWNSASRIFNTWGRKTVFISIIMFHWVTEVSRQVGDEEGTKVNRNNMKICYEGLSMDRSALEQYLAWVYKA